MRQRIDLHEWIPAPQWRVVALLELEADDIVRPVMDELRVSVGGTELARRIRSEAGPIASSEHHARIDLCWHAEAHPQWFPSLDARLVLTPVDDDTTDVALTGAYEPPLGALGAVADRVLGHRVAEQSLRDFLSGVARRLTAELAHHGAIRRG